MSHLVLHTRVVTGVGGGPEKTIINSPRFLQHRGYPMVCAYMRDPRDTEFSELQRRAASKSVNLVPIDDHGPLDWRIVGRFRALCQTLKPAIWHGHDYKSDLLGLIMKRYFPTMKLITTTHGYAPATWKTPLYYAIDRRCLTRYDHVICVSEDLLETVISAGVHPERCTFIPNAIDTEEFARKESTTQAKARHGVPSGRHVVGAVGRLSAEKGFDILIGAVHSLVTQDKLDIELWIVGEGDERPALERQIEGLQLGERIKLLGFRADTIDLYQAMDLYVLSSLTEGLPNVLLEAMAIEVPVLATRVGGVPGVIEHDVTGVLVAPNSGDTLRQEILTLLTDAAKRSELATRARKHIEVSYSFANRMERIKTIYDEMMDMTGIAA